MSVTEEQRRNLYAALERLIGPEQARPLMELLPRHPMSELVTRSDSQANTIMLRGEMAELRSDLTGEMAELRSDLRGEMAELQGEMVELRADLQDQMTVISAELRSEMAGLSSRLDARMVALESGLRGEMAELRGEMAELRGEMAELRGDFRHQIGGLYRWGAALMATNGAALMAALIT